MSGKGILFHVGDNLTGQAFSEVAKDAGYSSVLQHDTIDGALERLKSFSKPQLQSVKTFLIADTLNAVTASENMGDRIQSLFGDERPPVESLPSFLAGRIKQIYSQQGLTPPPVILETTVMRKYPNGAPTLPHIDGVVDLDADAENPVTALRAARIISEQQGRVIRRA